jgi:hypothetical protein
MIQLYLNCVIPKRFFVKIKDFQNLSVLLKYLIVSKKALSLFMVKDSMYYKTKKQPLSKLLLILKIFIDYFLKPNAAIIALYLAISFFLR